MLEFHSDGHRYTWCGRPVPSVTTVIRTALGDPFERVAATVLELARQRGKAVHKACELDDAGELDETTVDARIVPYIDAWRRFRKEFPFTVLEAEKERYNAQHGYAGTPDCLIAFGRRDIAVVDRKTGLPGIGAALQTAAYARFWLNGDSMRRFALRMMPTGKYQFTEYKDPGDWRDFLACLAVHRLKERLAA